MNGQNPTNDPQLEFGLSDGSRECVVTLTLSGNPWTDLGVVGLCEVLSRTHQSFLLEAPVWSEHFVQFRVDPSYEEEIHAWLLDAFRGGWNNLYWPSRAAKFFGRSLVYEDGFVDPSQSFELLPDQQAQFKEKFPQGSVKPTQALTQNRLNYVGMPADARKIQADLTEVIQDLVSHWLGTAGAGKKPSQAKHCDTCGQPNFASRQVTQGLNPLLNKHHNTQVRGFSGGNSYFQICPVCYAANLYAALEGGIPFVYDPPSQQRCLILPHIPDLELLRQVYHRLGGNLRDLMEANQLRTSTNLPVQWAQDRYSLAISLFHNLFYRLSVAQDTAEESWSFAPIPAAQAKLPQLTHWLLLPFVKVQNIRFGNMHVVEVDTHLYDLVKPIPLGETDEIRLVLDILSRMHSRHPGGVSVIEKLSRAIATSDSSLLCQVLFDLWKRTDAIYFVPQEGRPHPTRLLPHFVHYFLEVNAVLNDELRGDLRILGTMIGSVFSRDVTLVSKLYNVSSEGALRSALNQVLFRLYKVGLSGKVDEQGFLRVAIHGESKTTTRIKPERFTRVLEQLSAENWREAAETLSTFASLAAFNSNWPQSKQTDEE